MLQVEFRSQYKKNLYVIKIYFLEYAQIMVTHSVSLDIEGHSTKYSIFSEYLPIKLRKIVQTKTDLDASFLSCSVCEDQAYCKHYGVITCEGFSFIT